LIDPRNQCLRRSEITAARRSAEEAHRPIDVRRFGDEGLGYDRTSTEPLELESLPGALFPFPSACPLGFRPVFASHRSCV
jgi:hypothetical protein